MQNVFSVTSRHTVIDANYCHYTVPIYHPVRTMDMHDLIYMLDGEWMIGQENKVYRVHKDDVLILGANLHHFGVRRCSPGTKTMFLHVSCEHGDGVFSGTDTGDQPLIRTHINTASNPNIRQLFEKIILAKSEGCDTKAAAYFEALLFEFSDLASMEHSGNLASDIRNCIVAASDTIPKNTELAATFHVSVKTAENAFKNAYQMTIHQFVLKTKIEQAKTYLLIYPEMTLAEIAKNLGFYDEYHLSRQFKRICGQSPSAFKQQHQK